MRETHVVEGTRKPGTVFLFPLSHVVFFPHTMKPLNIFEPRYVKMVNDAIERDVHVALAYAEPTTVRRQKGGLLSHVRGVAGVGRVKLLERRSDGTMLILLEGEGKVQLEGIVESDEPYLMARSKWIEEDNTVAKENVFLLNRVSKELVRWLESQVEDPLQREAFLSRVEEPVEKVNYFCSLLVEDPQWQQALLEANSLNEKLKLASVLLDRDLISH